MAEIDGKAVTERVYVDRYWPTYIRTIPSYPLTTWTTTTCGASGAVGAASSAYSLAQNASNQIGSGGVAFNSCQAMAALGRAEAASMENA